MRTVRQWIKSIYCRVPYEVAYLRASALWHIDKICEEPMREAVGRYNKGKRSKSKFRGVAFHSHNKMWYARIKKEKVVHDLGYFADEYEAAAAYNIAARNMFGSNAEMNVR